jgi:rubrerythrin
MAASGSAAPRLEFTVSWPRVQGDMRTFSVCFETQAGTADRLVVSCRATGSVSQTQFFDVVEVAFYPIEIDGQLVYVTSVWQWNPSVNDRELIHDGLFYSNDNTGSDIDPGQLLPIDVSRHNRRTFRFSLAEVDRSLDENWWARFNWNAARHRTYAGSYLVASSDNPRYASLPLRLYASRTAGDSSEDDDDWAENDDDAAEDDDDAAEDDDDAAEDDDDAAEDDDDAADISALEAAMMPEDKEHLAAWRCPACLNGTQEDCKLVAAHAQHVDRHGNNVWHVFHRRCLRRWRAKREFEDRCPTCKQPCDPRPLPAVWSAGNTRLNARMGVNLYSV